LEKAMTPRKKFRKGKRFPKVPIPSIPPGRAGLTPVHARAAGIDVHSREHYVAVPPESVPPESVPPESVPAGVGAGRLRFAASEFAAARAHIRVFPTDTRGLEELAAWLVTCGIATVAMESTGIYHTTLMDVIQRHGIDVVVADARQTANAPGRPKTDVLDCQWIQRLHSCGMLRASFVPPADGFTCRLFTLPPEPR
jgi:transposase